MRVIKDNQVIDDDWLYLKREDIVGNLPAGNIIVPFSYWLEHKDQLRQHQGNITISINGDDDIDAVAANLEYFPMLALEFPQFKDGRCYSQARLLRERYGYKGELRAVGDVLRDQLFFMRRCGIDSFQIREDKDIEDAIKGFSDFSVTYQTAADGALPVYKNR